MNRFRLPQALVEQLGWVLVHSVWQLALIALVALVLMWAMRRASAGRATSCCWSPWRR